MSSVYIAYAQEIEFQGYTHHQSCILPTNSQQVMLQSNASKEASYPSCHTKQGQISCAAFGHPILTNSLHLSPTEIAAHNCQPPAQIHSLTFSHITLPTGSFTQGQKIAQN